MNIREPLDNLYWKMQSILAPSLKYSQYLYEDVLKTHVAPACVWLDIGCGHELLPPWRSTEEKKLITPCKMVVGLDYDLPSLKKHQRIHYKVRGNASQLPFKNNSFDLITANMVVEHFDNTAVQFQEISALLKPGGLFIFHTPNVFGYTTILTRLVPDILKGKLVYLLQGRKEEDVFPAYYRANSESTIRKLAQSTGFCVQKIKMIVTSAQFAVIPPFAFLELLWIRVLMTKPMKNLRTNIIVILEKT